MILLYLSMVFFHWIFSYKFSFLNLNPDIIFIYVFWVNYYKKGVAAITFSFFSGIFADFYYNLPFGSHCLAFSLFSFILSRVRKNLDITSIIPRFINFVVSNYFLILFLFLLNSLIYGFPKKWQFIDFTPFLNFVFFEIFMYILNNFFIKRREYVRLR
ncbi:MAG: rod shape-determining protein MreD [Elusimicrobiota bacterium]